MKIAARIKVSIYTELMVKKDLPWAELVYGEHRLSEGAMDVLNGAYQYLTGILLGVNDYYLAESMTEAICFAETEGI